MRTDSMWNIDFGRSVTRMCGPRQAVGVQLPAEQRIGKHLCSSHSLVYRVTSQLIARQLIARQFIGVYSSCVNSSRVNSSRVNSPASTHRCQLTARQLIGVNSSHVNFSSPRVTKIKANIKTFNSVIYESIVNIKRYYKCQSCSLNAKVI